MPFPLPAWRAPLWRALAVACLFLAGAKPSWALDPHRVIDAYGHDSWTRQNSLPGEAVYQIEQTSDGYVWLRVSDRLVRFDGTSFHPIETDIPYLADEPVRAISLTSEGDLLVRSREHLLRYHDGEFKEVRPKAALPDAMDRLVYQSHDGRIWIGADNHLYVAKDQGFAYVIRGSSWVNAMMEDRTGNLWIGAFTGLYRFRDGQFTIYPANLFSERVVTTPPPGSVPAGATPKPIVSPEKVKQVLSLLEDRDGTLWVGTHNEGLYKFVDGQLVSDATTEPLAKASITALTQDRDGNLWVGTDASGIFRLADGKWSAFTVQDGLKDNSILSLCEDREGSLWVGTRGGLDRFRDTPIVAYTSKQGLSSDEAYSIVEGADHSVYVVTAAGLNRVKDGEITAYTQPDGLGGAYGTLYRDPDGSTWFGTTAGLSRLQGDTVTSFNAVSRLSHRYISAMASDSESLILAHVGFELVRLKNGVLAPYTLDGAKTPFTANSGIYIFTMYRAKDGALWLGTTDGLYKLKHGEPVAKQKGIDFPVTSIYDDESGSFWLAGDVPGVFRLRLEDGRVTHYQKQNGLLDGEITQALTDVHGNLWLSTSRGIWSIDRWELDELADGRRAAVHCTSFDTFDGMKTNECSNNRHTPGGCRTEDGRLWFTTRKGVVVIDPDHIPRNSLVPPVVVESLIADQHQFATGAEAVLQPGTSKLEIHYTCLSLLVPARVSFRYRLEGYDREWVDAGSRRVAYYTNLPPGDYRFQVIACNNDGVWNSQPATMAFYLTPRFVQTKWFIGLCVGGLILVAAGSYHLRLRQLSRREKALAALVDQRTQSLREEIRVREKVEQDLRAEIEVRHKAEAETARVHQELVAASHRAGMAEIATGVLHNVGNALNSVNVSTSLVAQRVKGLRVAVLGKVAAVLHEQGPNLPRYLTEDEKGRQMPNYLAQLAKYFEAEQKALVAEIHQLATGLEHMKALVARQQDYARVSGVAELVSIDALIEDALTINADRLKNREIAVSKHLEAVPPIMIEKHKVVQILVNLIANASDACADVAWGERRIEVKSEQVGERVRVAVTDNGIGIPPENLTRIFGQGFTTKKQGHGFGLHSSVLAATAMGGTLQARSAGTNQGATFVLELPLTLPRSVEV